MITVRELCNTLVGQITIMEMWVNGKKVAEDDITEMTCQELQEAIRQQEREGRAWSYKTVPCPYAEFIGFQENVEGKLPEPLYNIKGGPKHGSTVSKQTLLKLGIEIP